MLIRKIFYNGKRYVSTCGSMPRRNIQQIEDTQVIESKTNLPEPKKKLERREPFLKNIFIGQFDTHFLTFIEPQSDERYKEFFEWMKPIESYMTSVTSTIGSQVSRNEAFRKLKELDILRARVDKKYDGLNMLETETLKLLETLSPLPWLARSLVKNNIMAIDLIHTYGNKEQKKKYLPKIGNGDLLPTICVSEINSGPNIQNIKTTSMLSECGNFWILNGKKIFVTNGEDSNLYFVVARCAKDRTMQFNTLSTFIVESNDGGITCSKNIDTVGQTEVHVCEVDFKNTYVPKENVLGEFGEGINVLTDVLAPGNSQVAGEAIGILRNFLSLLNKNILERKHFDKSMHEFEMVRKIVTNMTCNLYCMESVAYFTSAIRDAFENQDLELEKAVVETYCANKCAEQIYKGLQIIGAEAYLKGNPYMKLYKDAIGLSIYEGSVIDDKAYIALLGLQYTGKHLYENVHKRKNILMYPNYLFKKVLFNRKPNALHLFEYLHPSFKIQADILEQVVFALEETSMVLLTRHGTEITSKQMILEKLANVTIEIYVLTAVLARASRSYCIGVRNSESERYIAGYIAQHAHKTIEMLLTDINDYKLQNRESIIQMIAEAVFEKKGYMCENPLTRTH